jgi:hypothetical protein
MGIKWVALANPVAGELNDGNHSFNCRAIDGNWRIPGMAIQQWLGLLPKRWTRFGGDDSRCLTRLRSYLKGGLGWAETKISSKGISNWGRTEMGARIRVSKRNKLRTTAALKSTAVKIGSAIGMVDGVAHKAARRATTAVKVAKRELAGLSKQLNKSSKRLTLALKG